MGEYKNLFIVSTLLFSLSIIGIPTDAADIEPTSGSIITLKNPRNLSVGLRLQRDRREFKTGDELLGLDINHALLQIGVTPLPFLSLLAEGGASHAERIDDKGNGALQWGFGVHVKALEYIIESTPVVGTKKAVALEIDISYSHCESDFSDKDISWDEFIISPLLSYTSHSTRRHTWFSNEPAATAIRGGPVFISTDGDYGETSLKENNNFGGRIICDFLLGGGRVTRKEGIFIGSDERQIAFGVARHF